jgi:4-amino-4-deoxy-L-arabinose transferase-like glycosyltransferase
MPVATAPTASEPSWAYRLSLVAVFAGALALRMHGFTEPWTGVHNAWAGGFYGNVARNFVRYGFLTTTFAPVTNSGVVDPSQFELYYHHPPMTMWLTALSFHVFGIHEWAARLAPLVFSLLTIALVVSFARQLFGRGPALLAALLMAVVPADAYYAAHLDPNSSMAIFFTTLVVEAYRRWRATAQDRYFALAGLALVLGCMTAWYAYLIVPGLLLHFAVTTSMFRKPFRETLRSPAALRVALLPVLAIAVFGMFLLHRDLAFAGGNPELFDTLSTRVMKRTVNYDMTRTATMAKYMLQIGSLYTVTFMVLALTWAVMFLRDVRMGRATAADWWLPLLCSYPVLYALAFPGHLPGHNFFVRPYVPGIAVAGALVLIRASRLVQPGRARHALLAALVVITCVPAVMRTRTLFTTDDHENAPGLQKIASVIARATSEREAVFLPIRHDRVLQYYVDRPARFDIDTPAKLAEAVTETSGRYLVVMPERSARDFPELVTYLESRYRPRREQGVLLFEGSNDAAH